MNTRRNIYTPPGGPPAVERPSPQIYAHMGEANIQQMIAAFYKRLDQSPLAPMFADKKADAVERSAAFFVNILGGPPRYQERYGAPKMRARHLPFAIDEKARQVWLRCFAETLDEAPDCYEFPAEHRDSLMAFLDQFSRWMVNVKPAADDTDPPGNQGLNLI